MGCIRAHLLEKFEFHSYGHALEILEATVIVRGLRAISDFEYELQMAQTNHKMNPQVDTMFLATSLEYSYLSSTIVKEVAFFGGNISEFVPEPVIGRVHEKVREKTGK